MAPAAEPCPLCPPALSTDRSARAFFTGEAEGVREFFSCGECGVIFVPRRFHLRPEDEKSRYDLHRNYPEDAGYRAYLSRILDPLRERVPRGSRGLDFGSGPGPVLALMLEEAGYEARIYDPFYAPDASVLEAAYDFVTMTEVAEHLRDPRRTLEEVWALVKPGGWLGILTQSPPSAEEFARWKYKNDATHLVFYSRATFEWLARRWNAQVEFPGRDAVFLRRV